MNIYFLYSLCIIFSYLLGSLNFAIIVSHLVKHDDVRKYGSKNAGMTNMMRTYGKKIGSLTLIGDFLKAVVAISLCRLAFSLIFPESSTVYVSYLSALFCMLGHIFPIFYSFKGGKGVLTSGACVLMLHPTVFVFIMLIFLVCLMLSKMVSLSSILACIGAAIGVLFVGLYTGADSVVFETVVISVMSATIIIKHSSNIKRIIAGNENKIGKKKEG